jgi:hypothetical protein
MYGRSRRHWPVGCGACGFDGRIHEYRIEGFEGMVGPGGNDDPRVRWCWYPEFLESAEQQECRRPVFAQRGRVADPDKQFGAKSRLTHAPGASSTTHRIADEDVYLSKCPRGFQKTASAVGEGAGLRRLSIPRLIHGIAVKTCGGERLAETKEHFFRGTASVREECNGMRTGRRGGKSKGRCVRRQHDCFDADARLDHA